MSDRIDNLEQEVSELSKELIRSQRDNHNLQSILQSFATGVADLLEVGQEDRQSMKLQDLLGVLATKVGKPDPEDNVEIE